MIIKIPVEVYRSLLTTAAKGGTRYAMNGILVQAGEREGRLYFVSSDTHRMTVYSPAEEVVDEKDLEAFVPRQVKTAQIDAKTKKPIMEDRHGLIVATKAFIARATKPSRHGSARMTVDLTGLREAELIDGQFPRWRDVWPSSKSIVAMTHTEQGTQFIPGLCMNLRYILDGEDMIASHGGEMRQTQKDSPLFCENGDRPWKVKVKPEMEYSGLMIMPVHSEKTVLEGHS